jgi:hypothetical protein
MEAIYSSKNSVHFQLTTRRYIPEDRSLQDNCKFPNLPNCLYEYERGGTALSVEEQTSDQDTIHPDELLPEGEARCTFIFIYDFI